jgi:hypothetical protein
MSQRLSVSVAAFPLQMRQLHAGGDLSQPNHIHLCTDRALMRSKHTPRCTLHAPDLACRQTCRSHPASVTSTIQLGASIKSP